jgi:hypothetical protein
MADIPKFTVVKTTGATGRLTTVQAYDPTEDVAPAISIGNKILGVTLTPSNDPEVTAVLRDGYIRGVNSTTLTGWEPSLGAQIWCGPNGKPTTTRPATGVLVLVGTYMGQGDVDVHVRVLPSIGELSFVKREIPEQSDVFVFDVAEGLFVPRILDHGNDLVGLEDDDHSQYSLESDLTNLFLFMGAN